MLDPDKRAGPLSLNLSGYYWGRQRPLIFLPADVAGSNDYYFADRAWCVHVACNPRGGLMLIVKQGGYKEKEFLAYFFFDPQSGKTA